MSKEEYIKRWAFPNEWLEWDMFPDELFEVIDSCCEEPPEGTRENDNGWERRSEALDWWIDRDLTEEQLAKLCRLLKLDPYPEALAEYKNSIDGHESCTEKIRKEFLGRSREEHPLYPKEKFFEFLEFPREWLEWDMFSDEELDEMFSDYVLHYENEEEEGNSPWEFREEIIRACLSQDLSEERLKKLCQLLKLDPYPWAFDNFRFTIDNHASCTVKIREDYLRIETPGLSKHEFTKLMNFPDEWLEWNMFPENLFYNCLKFYEGESEGDEFGEYFGWGYRQAAFCWWYKRELTEEQFKILTLLLNLDPNPEALDNFIYEINEQKHCTDKTQKMM